MKNLSFCEIQDFDCGGSSVIGVSKLCTFKEHDPYHTGQEAYESLNSSQDDQEEELEALKIQLAEAKSQHDQLS